MPTSLRSIDRPAVPDRPVLLPGLACLTRDDTSLQLGVEPPHAIVLRGVRPAHLRVLRAMDGRHDRAGLTRLARDLGIGARALDDLLAVLAAHHLLVPCEPRTPSVHAGTGASGRLGPDLTALALRHAREPGGGLDAARSILARRSASWVEVHGAGRVGAGIAAILAAAGVGRVSVVDPGRCTPADVGPTGLQPDAVGTGREPATRARIEAVAPGAVSAAPASSRAPDLCVLAPDAGPSAPLAATWARRSEPQVLAYVRETTGVIGPLVVPGRTACLSCLDEHRRDRDPGWPRVAVQLADGPPRRACEVALATLVAAQCSLQALAFLDGDVVAVLGATLEVADNGSTVRRRQWPPHPRCGCRWSSPDLAEAATLTGRTNMPRSTTMTA